MGWIGLLGTLAALALLVGFAWWGSHLHWRDDE